MIDVKRFHPIRFNDTYLIDKSGIVINRETERVLEPYGTEMRYVHIPEISQNGYRVAWLVLDTFIGPFNASEGFRDNNPFNCELSNLYYTIERIAQLSNKVWMINQEIFKEIPNFKNYLISLHGVVFGLKRGNFLPIAFNHNGYSVVTITDDSGFRAPRKIHRLVYETFIDELDPALTIDHIDSKKFNNDVFNVAQIPIKDNVNKGLERFNRKSQQFGAIEIRKICEHLVNGDTIDVIANDIGRTSENERFGLERMIYQIAHGTIHGRFTRIISQYDFSKIRDSVKKPKNRNTVLDWDAVHYIREHANEMTREEFAAKFNCAASLITLVIQNKIWVE